MALELGKLRAAQGDHAGAEPYYARARSIFEQSVGKDSPEVATVLEAQAASLQARGRGAEAAPLLKRAAEIRAAGK